MEDYKALQLIKLDNTESHFTINKVTEKAIMIETSDGRWGGDGFIPVWIPKSIIIHLGFNDSRDNSQYGIHRIFLPEWFVKKNSKQL